MAAPTIPTVEIEAYRAAMEAAEASLKKQLDSTKDMVSQYEKVKTILEAEEEYDKNRNNALKELKEIEKSREEIRQKIADIAAATNAADKQAARDALKDVQTKFNLLKQEFDDKEKEYQKDRERQKKLATAAEEDRKKAKEAQEKLFNMGVAAAQQISKIGSSLIEGFNLPLLGTKIKGIREIVFSTLTAPAEAFKKYGFLDQYTDSINNMRQEMLGFGVDEKSMREAVGELNQGLADFSGYSRATQESLINTTAKLGLAGFSAGKTTAAMVSLTKAFGQTGTQAADTVKRIAALSLTLGQGQKGLDDYIALTPKLVGFGARAEKVFSDTAIAAKKLGMDTKELFNIMDQYDSFEKAADAAGELNAALGGQFIDSLELMKASLEGGTTDTLNIFQKAFKQAGIEVENLKRADIKYYAAAAKISEQEFMQIFRKGGQGVEGYIKKQEEAAKKQQDLNDIAKRTQDVFQNIQNEFAKAFGKPETIKTFVGVIKDLATLFKDYLLPAVKWMAEHPKTLIAFFAVGPLASAASSMFMMYKQMQAIRALTSLAGVASGAGSAGSGILGSLSGVAGGASGAGAGLGAFALPALGVLGAAGAGYWIGTKINEWLDKPSDEQLRQREVIRENMMAVQQTEVGDYSIGGGAIISGGGINAKTNKRDTIVAAQPGGILDQKLDIIIGIMKESANRPLLVELDGHKVNKQLAEANRTSPFTT